MRPVCDELRSVLRCGIIQMNVLSCILVMAAGWSPSANAQEKVVRVAAAGSNDEWYVEGTERAGDGRFDEYMGRRSLWLRNNTQIMKSETEFVNGTIEFDVAPMEKGDFVGILFRRASFQNHENVYLRIPRSGQYDAVQYAPRMNGSPTWQLYPEFNAVADLPRNQWTHVRMEVNGTKLEVYVNNQQKPALVVPRLRGIPQKGSVAFWGRVNGQPTLWAAALSNISIRPTNPGTPGTVTRAAPPATTLTSWEVAGPVQTDKGSVMTVPQLKEWRPVEVEESGLVNFNRELGTSRGRWTGFARATVKADQAKTMMLQLGYSDDVTVFLNGAGVYSGINGFESRYPGYLGYVKPDFENVFIKLRPGNNEIILAVTDDQRFGWGFIARLRDSATFQP